MKWTHDGKEVQHSEKYEEVFVEEQGLAKLKIKDFVPKDKGEYSCVVSGEVIEPETGMLRQAKTISTTTVAEVVGKWRMSWICLVFVQYGERIVGAHA